MNTDSVGFCGFLSGSRLAAVSFGRRSALIWGRLRLPGPRRSREWTVTIGSRNSWPQVPLFEGLSKKELKLVSQLATPLEEPEGTVLVREGAAGHEFIIVLDGEIEVRKGDRVIATRGPGTYVGEIALLDHRPRTATVVAKTPVSIEVIGQREFAGLLSEVPEISQKLIPAMAKRLADLDEVEAKLRTLLVAVCGPFAPGRARAQPFRAIGSDS